MNNWHKGKLSQAKSLSTKPDERIAIHSEYYEGTENGYQEHNLTMHVLKDGALTISDDAIDGGFVYLYPEQVKHLKKILAGKRHA